MYTLLKTWKTPLCYCDCESCFVSYMLPCHVYAKLKQGNYTINCLLYLGLWCMIHFVYSYHYYSYTNACPSTEIEYCIRLNESVCEQYYMLVNSVHSKCVFHSDINLCTYDTYSCIAPEVYTKINMWTFIISTMLYTFLWWLHYTLRKEIQYRNDLEDPASCLATSCCSTCGLAQEYREII